MSSTDVEKAWKDYEPYIFLPWIGGYLKPRSKKSNMQSVNHYCLSPDANNRNAMYQSFSWWNSSP